MQNRKPAPKPNDDIRKAAQEYQEQKGGAPLPARSAPRTEAEFRDLVSRRIEEAINEGAFDNLPSHGKPLELSRNPYAPAGSEMAFDLLKNNDLAPAWIGLRTELLRDIERWRARVAEVTGRPGGSPETLQARRRLQKEAWQLELQALNKRIVNLNLQQPIAHLELLQLRLDDELRRAGAAAWLEG